MSRPASLNMPFSSATAQGKVATRRPYWLTVILAAQAGVAANAVAVTTAATVAWILMGLASLFHNAARALIARCMLEICTLGFRPSARSPLILPRAPRMREWRCVMRIVHGDQVEEKIRIHQHRQGMFRHRTVAAGEPGTPGNFILELVRTTDDFFSPRHKHNFDQFR